MLRDGLIWQGTFTCYPSEPTFIVNEIHANARFDVIQNKGFWINENGEQEIDKDDWFNPRQESYFYQPKQPNNPNYLAIVTGCTGCRMNGTYEGVFIGKVFSNSSQVYFDPFVFVKTRLLRKRIKWRHFIGLVKKDIWSTLMDNLFMCDDSSPMSLKILFQARINLTLSNNLFEGWLNVPVYLTCNSWDSQPVYKAVTWLMSHVCSVT